MQIICALINNCMEIERANASNYVFPYLYIYIFFVFPQLFVWIVMIQILRAYYVVLTTADSLE